MSRSKGPGAIRFLDAAKPPPAEEWWRKLRPLLEEYLRKLSTPPTVNRIVDREGRLLLESTLQSDHDENRPSRGKKRGQIVNPDHFFNSYAGLLKVGGKLQGVSVIFGDAGDFRMEFKPYTDGTMKVGSAVALGSDGLKAELNKSNRGLWDKEHNRPGTEYRAIEYASEITLRLEEIFGVVRSGQNLPMLDLREIHIALSDLIECCRRARDKRFAIRLGNPCKFFDQFNRVQTEASSEHFDSPVESSEVRKMKNGALCFAKDFQRPPTQKELRQEIKWRTLRTLGKTKPKAPGRHSEFKKMLSHAGLTWLPTHWDFRKLGIRVASDFASKKGV
jgi:hypothetical protein